MDYFREQQEWIRQVTTWLGPDATLVHVSSHSSDIRVYGSTETVAKVRRLSPASVQGRQNSLESEFLILTALSAGSGERLVFPEALRYSYSDGWEMLELRRIDPPQAGDPVVSPGRDRMSDLIALTRGVLRLNRFGVSHGDLVRDNAGINSAGDLVILDFDQALMGSPFRCFLRDFFGIPLCKIGSQFTVMSRLARHKAFSPIRALLRGFRSKRSAKRSDSSFVDQVALRNHSSLTMLARAWQRATASGANNPEAPEAYYSLDVSGIHFPGERPWVLRWERIRRGVSFSGKTIVELGCNLGLLSIHALMAGARAAKAADGNAEVINAASMAANAFGVEIDLHTINFDEDADWESKLGFGDLVTVLSLTHWLKDKARLWSYVGRFAEVVFEGHEEKEDTIARLRSAGFTSITELGLSDRSRPLFYATRSPG